MIPYTHQTMHKVSSKDVVWNIALVESLDQVLARLDEVQEELLNYPRRRRWRRR